MKRIIPRSIVLIALALTLAALTYTLAFAQGGVVLLPIVAGGSPPTSTPLPPTATPTPTSTPTSTPQATATPTHPTFSGTGSQITGNFEETDGFIILDMVFSGEGNFIVWVKNALTGESVELLANEIGAYDGRRAALVEPGWYFLEIDADGAWTVGVLPTAQVGSTNLPVTFTGSGPDVPAQFQSSGGRVDFTVQYQGESNFIVWLYDVTNKETVDLLANEIGSWSGQKSRNLPNGWYLLDVEATGSWSIDVRPN